MIWKHGLYAAENSEAYEIVAVKKVRRVYEIVGEGNPLMFITAVDIGKLGVSKRDPLPIDPDTTSGILYSLSSMDISKLMRQNTASQPKKWSRFLDEYIHRVTVFQSIGPMMQFRSDDAEIDTYFDMTKSAGNKVDSPHFREGKIILPAVTCDEKQRTFMIIDIPNRVLMVWEEAGKGKSRAIKNVERFELGIGRIGQFKHLKWPRPSRDAQKLVNECLIWTQGVPEQ